MKKAIDELELELRTIDEDLKQKNRQLDVVTATKQLQALEHEVAMLIRKKESINDLQVDQWLAYEAAQQTQAVQTPVADEHLCKLSSGINDLLHDIEKTNLGLAEAHEEHASLAALFDDHWQAIYQRMKAHINNPVVIVQKDACGGCFYPLQVQMLIKLRHSEVLSCGLCSRLLIHAPLVPLTPTTSQ